MKASVAGIAATLLLHGFALAPLTWGGHVERHRTPDMEGSSASQHDSNLLDSMMVVFTEDSGAIGDPARNDSPSTRPFLLPQPALAKVARPHLTAANLDLSDEPENRIPTEANGDEPGRSMLFGRYMGQISARVERAWIRPRSVPSAGKFTCRAQITQDRKGQVQEVTLQECTNDPRWQVSLVRAINGASPFPAPPDLSVFSNLITVEFDSDPYVPGASEEGFEPNMPAFASAVPADSPSRSSPPVGRTVREVLPDGTVKLTIIGPANNVR